MGWLLHFLIILVLEAGVASTCEGEVKIRREWRQLTGNEQDFFINAMRALWKAPASEGCSYPMWPLLRTVPAERLRCTSKYDEFVAFHVLHGTHNGPVTFEDGGTCSALYTVPYHNMTVCDGFLPWHRRFLQEFEGALRSLGPDFECVTIPYWDWTMDLGAGEMNSPVLDAFGGWGESSSVQANMGGTLAGSAAVNGVKILGKEWRNTLGSSFSTVYRRNNADGLSKDRAEMLSLYHINSLGPGALNNTFFAASNYLEFEGVYTTQGGFGGLEVAHGALHLSLGAPPNKDIDANFTQMADALLSPFDPIFFLHHAMVDKLWTLRQRSAVGRDDSDTYNGSVSLRGFSGETAAGMWDQSTTVVYSDNVDGFEI